MTLTEDEKSQQSELWLGHKFVRFGIPGYVVPTFECSKSKARVTRSVGGKLFDLHDGAPFTFTCPE